MNLHAQTNAQQITAGATTAANAPKSFTEVYPAIAPSLRKLCDAGEDDSELPEFWQLFAAARGKKQQCFPALEALLSTRANDPASARVHPILPAKLYESLAQFKLGNPNIDKIHLGLSPFMMCPSGYPVLQSQQPTSNKQPLYNDKLRRRNRKFVRFTDFIDIYFQPPKGSPTINN